MRRGYRNTAKVPSPSPGGPHVTGLAAVHHARCWIDWRQARADVARFVPAREQGGLRAWGAPFFSQLLEQLAAYLPER
jgi:hypothetical protein